MRTYFRQVDWDHLVEVKKSLYGSFKIVGKYLSYFKFFKNSDKEPKCDDFIAMNEHGTSNKIHSLDVANAFVIYLISTEDFEKFLVSWFVKEDIIGWKCPWNIFDYLLLLIC